MPVAWRVLPRTRARTRCLCWGWAGRAGRGVHGRSVCDRLAEERDILERGHVVVVEGEVQHAVVELGVVVLALGTKVVHLDTQQRSEETDEGRQTAAQPTGKGCNERIGRVGDGVARKTRWKIGAKSLTRAGQPFAAPAWSADARPPLTDLVVVAVSRVEEALHVDHVVAVEGLCAVSGETHRTAKREQRQQRKQQQQNKSMS